MARAHTVLLADDNKLTLSVLNDVLTRAGYDVITANDGARKHVVQHAQRKLVVIGQQDRVCPCHCYSPRSSNFSVASGVSVGPCVPRYRHNRPR